MVNKAIVGILVLIVLTSLGVGVLIGTQIGGGGGGAPADDGDGGDGSSTDGSGGDATATPTNTTNGTATNGTATNGTATNGTATPTTTTQAPTATPDQTATPTQTGTPTATTIPSENFSTSLIEAEMIEDINRGRGDRGLDRYSSGGTTWRQLREMVRTHSDAMAAEQRASFAINDYANASERYKGSNLYDRCKYQDAEGGFIVKPTNDFQAVSGKVKAGQEYTDDGQTRFNANESAVAQAIVDDWFASPTYQRPLLTEETDLIAVGVTLADDGEVYASAAICS